MDRSWIDTDMDKCVNKCVLTSFPSFEPQIPHAVMRGDYRGRDGSGDITFTVRTMDDYKDMENHRSNCAFFLKTGVCMFGDACQQTHLTREHSPTILIKNLFFHDYLEDLASSGFNEGKQVKYAPRNADGEEDMLAAYERFYHNLMKMFGEAGPIIWFKCARNLSSHLRGNTYIQFEDSASAREAVRMFDGSYFEDHRLKIELTPVTMWKLAICGNYDEKVWIL